MIMPVIKTRLFDGNPAVVHRTPTAVVIDREKLPPMDRTRFVHVASSRRYVLFWDAMQAGKNFGRFAAYPTRNDAVRVA